VNNNANKSTSVQTNPRQAGVGFHWRRPSRRAALERVVAQQRVPNFTSRPQRPRRTKASRKRHTGSSGEAETLETDQQQQQQAASKSRAGDTRPLTAVIPTSRCSSCSFKPCLEVCRLSGSIISPGTTTTTTTTLTAAPRDGKRVICLSTVTRQSRRAPVERRRASGGEAGHFRSGSRSRREAAALKGSGRVHQTYANHDPALGS